MLFTYECLYWVLQQQMEEKINRKWVFNIRSSISCLNQRTDAFVLELCNVPLNIDTLTSNIPKLQSHHSLGIPFNSLQSKVNSNRCFVCFIKAFINITQDNAALPDAHIPDDQNFKQPVCTAWYRTSCHVDLHWEK